jgi:hypothetical protein
VHDSVNCDRFMPSQFFSSPVLLLFMLSILFAAPRAHALPAEVILFRHAEKPLDPRDPDLSKAGYERARTLASYLTTTPGLTNRGPPAVLFATGWTRHEHSRRPYETLEPLARQLHRPIKRPFLAEQYPALARHILTSRECDGKVVVVCWVHDYLPQLAAALGVRPTPAEWKKHIFDRVWRINWPNGSAELKEFTEPSPSSSERLSGNPAKMQDCSIRMTSVRWMQPLYDLHKQSCGSTVSQREHLTSNS